MVKNVCYEGKDHTGECVGPCEGCESYGKDRRVEDRRKRGISFKLKERREGFDRRKNQLRNKSIVAKVFAFGAIYLRHSQTLLAILLVLFILLNLADYLFTLKALAAGFVEINPIMDKMFSVSSALAGVFKVGATIFITAVIWVFKRYRVVLEASILFLLIYIVLIVYHIYGAIKCY